MHDSTRQYFIKLSVLTIVAIVLFVLWVEWDRYSNNGKLGDLILSAPFGIVLLSLPLLFAISVLRGESEDEGWIYWTALIMNILFLALTFREFLGSSFFSGHAVVYRFLVFLVPPVAAINTMALLYLRFGGGEASVQVRR